MAITVKSITLYRREVENRPGVLSQTLRPLADAKADLQVVMGYRYPADHSKAAIELYPISGRKAAAAAQHAGLSPFEIHTLLVQGDNRAGLGAAMTAAIAETGINIVFLVAQVLGRKFSAVFGFETREDAKRATGLIKKAAKR